MTVEELKKRLDAIIDGGYGKARVMIDTSDLISPRMLRSTRINKSTVKYMSDKVILSDVEE